MGRYHDLIADQIPAAMAEIPAQSLSEVSLKMEVVLALNDYSDIEENRGIALLESAHEDGVRLAQAEMKLAA
jgi:hypothetical protein